MNLIAAIWNFYVQNRKAKRVIETLRMEAKRLRLVKADRDTIRYVEGLADYLEEA